MTQWTRGTNGLLGAQAQAANMAETMELVAQLPSRIQAIRAAGVTKEMATLWSRFYLGAAKLAPVTEAAGNANALPRSILMQAIANLL